MLEYIIEGGKKLEGSVKISGSKNAALPIIEGTILSSKTTKLYNVPKIQDTKITLEILKQLGCKIRQNNGKIEINTKQMNKTEIPADMMTKMRSSITMAGAILSRFKEVTFSYPGGCEIGARPIDLHLKAFEKLGVNIEEKGGFIHCMCGKIIPTEIDLDFPSVGATENIILLTTLAEGTTTIRNAAMEPEIVDLSNFLNKMGAKIVGAGTNVIKITGVKSLKEIGYKIIPDRIEAGTYLTMFAVTGGKGKILNAEPEHIRPIIYKLEECGCNIDVNSKEIEINAPKRLKAIDIKTMPYPGFPTDMQSVFASMLSVAKGTSIVVENIFESRYKYISELQKMGAKVQIEGKTAIIKGVKHLNGAEVEAKDLRGGAALVLAGLNAKGRTKISNVQYIQRGYENLEEKLKNIGANVRLENT